jgi:hypothetical protein
MSEMSQEELLRMIREEFNLPELPDQNREPLPPAVPLPISAEVSGPAKITIAEFIQEEGVLRRIRLGHGVVPKTPLLEIDDRTGLVMVRFDSLALWTNALGALKTPVVKQKSTTFRAQYASQDALQNAIALPPHLTGLRNAFLPYSATQLMIAEGYVEAAELLQKFVTPLSLVVPKEFPTH